MARGNAGVRGFPLPRLQLCCITGWLRIARDARRGYVAKAEWIAPELRRGGMECRHRIKAGRMGGPLWRLGPCGQADRRA